MAANLPPLEPLNATLSRANRGITAVRFGMTGDPQTNLIAFARGNIADLAKRSIGNAEHLASAYLNVGFAEGALRLTAAEIDKHGLPRNTRANVAGIALLAASIAAHGALLAHIREDRWMQLNVLSLCRSSIEGAAKACMIARGTSNEAERWKTGKLPARPAVVQLSNELRSLDPRGEDAKAVYEWLCGFTIGGLLRGHIVALCGRRGGLRSVTTATSRSRKRVGTSLLIVEGTRERLLTSVACAA